MITITKTDVCRFCGHTTNKQHKVEKLNGQKGISTKFVMCKQCKDLFYNVLYDDVQEIVNDINDKDSIKEFRKDLKKIKRKILDIERVL